MGRRKPSDLATPVRDKIACRAWAWPDDDGRGSFEEEDVPFARGSLAGAGVSPELIIFGGSRRCSSAIERQALCNSLKQWVLVPFFFVPSSLSAGRAIYKPEIRRHKCRTTRRYAALI
jgi:hypothetical protein